MTYSVRRHCIEARLGWGEKETQDTKKPRSSETPRGGKRQKNSTTEDEDDADGHHKRPRATSQRGATPPKNAPAAEAGIPPQDMSVGENVPPEGGPGGLPEQTHSALAPPAHTGPGLGRCPPSS